MNLWVSFLMGLVAGVMVSWRRPSTLTHVMLAVTVPVDGETHDPEEVARDAGRLAQRIRVPLDLRVDGLGFVVWPWLGPREAVRRLRRKQEWRREATATPEAP